MESKEEAQLRPRSDVVDKLSLQEIIFQEIIFYFSHCCIQKHLKHSCEQVYTSPAGLCQVEQ